MEFHTNSGEILFYGMIVIGIVLIVFSRGFWLFLGILFVIGATLGGYSETQQSYAYRFAMEQFKMGAELNCGYLKGDNTLISLQSDWTYRDQIGFVKGDSIVDDEHCSVIGKESPSPSILLYAGIFIFSIVIAVLMRFAFGPNLKSSNR